MNHALTVDGLTKRYSGHTAVSQLSIAVPTGLIYGILGPNGAGKSTTLRMVLNILGRDGGTVSLLGTDPARDPTILRRVGYLPEERGLYRKMKVLDVIVFFAELKGMDRRAAAQEARVWLERMGLEKWEDAKVETLSKGMQQKVQFIATVLHRPDLLILDEPYSGLDPVNQEVLRETILGAKADGRTVVLCTHNMMQAQEMCDSVCIIANGRKVLDGSVREVRRQHRGSRYYVEFDARTPAVERYITTSPHIGQRERKRDGWEIEVRDATGARELAAELNALDAPLAHFEHLQPSLHDIFVMHVSDARHADRREEPAYA